MRPSHHWGFLQERVVEPYLQGRGGNSGGTWEPSSQKVFGLAESLFGYLPIFVAFLKSLLRIPKYGCRLASVCRLKELSA